jgi:hypothetical protein
MRLPEKDEVSGSLAISHGKIYLPTGAALYCLGKKDVKPSATAIPPQPKEEPAGKDDKPAWVQVTPGELLLKPGEQKKLSVLTFNAKGQRLPAKSDLNVTGDTSGKPSAKVFTATVGDIKGEVRGRTIPPLPWKFDFNDIELKPDANNPNLPPSGEPPLTWIGARYRHKIMEKDGDKAMVKITTIPRGTRSQCWMGPPDMHDYTIQADLRGQRTTQPAGAVAVSSDATGAEINPSSSENQALGLPDMGLIAQRYTLDMMGNSQQLQIRSWPPQVARRFAKTIPFHWDGDKWYTVKFSASADSGKAVLRGKVWPRGEKEPDKWTIEAVDDVPNLQGSPGLFGQSNISEIYIDNVAVTSNNVAATAKK